MLLRAVQSPEATLAGNAAGVLSDVCCSDPQLARRAMEAPGVLPALVAMLQWDAGDLGAFHAACAISNMAAGVDGLRPELAARLAAEEGLVLALAGFAQSSSSADFAPAACALAAMANAGGEDLAWYAFPSFY
jgi:hypothetical protein